MAGSDSDGLSLPRMAAPSLRNAKLNLEKRLDFYRTHPEEQKELERRIARERRGRANDILARNKQAAADLTQARKLELLAERAAARGARLQSAKRQGEVTPELTDQTVIFPSISRTKRALGDDGREQCWLALAAVAARTQELVQALEAHRLLLCQSAAASAIQCVYRRAVLRRRAKVLRARLTCLCNRVPANRAYALQRFFGLFRGGLPDPAVESQFDIELLLELGMELDDAFGPSVDADTVINDQHLFGLLVHPIEGLKLEKMLQASAASQDVQSAIAGMLFSCEKADRNINPVLPTYQSPSQRVAEASGMSQKPRHVASAWSASEGVVPPKSRASALEIAAAAASAAAAPARKAAAAYRVALPTRACEAISGPVDAVEGAVMPSAGAATKTLMAGTGHTGAVRPRPAFEEDDTVELENGDDCQLMDPEPRAHGTSSTATSKVAPAPARQDKTPVKKSASGSKLLESEPKRSDHKAPAKKRPVSAAAK